MSCLRLSFLFVAALAGCTAARTPAPVTATVEPRPPPPMPSHMVVTDFAAMVEHKVIQPLELEPVERGEFSVSDGAKRLDGDRLTLTSAMPGGWSESLYVDGAHRVWVVTRQGSFRGFRNAHVPATRFFSQTFVLPAGYVYAGVISLVDDPRQLPAMQGAIARAPRS